MIRTTCPQCGREDAIADYLASLPVLCKQCGQRVTMGEVIVPTKPPAAPPPATKAPPPPPPPPAPPKVVAPPPPPAPKPTPLPQPAPAPAVVALTPPEPPDLDPPVHTNGTVIAPRPAFANATGPGMVDLFEDVVIPEQRTARPPLPPVPPPAPFPAPMPVASVGVNFHRGRRLAARLITLAGAVIALAAGILLVGFAPRVVKNDRLMSMIFLFVPIGLYALYNVVLLGTQGQDFGKRALKLRVVGDDGTPARFAQAFLKRELVVILLLAGLIPLAWKLYKFQQTGELAGMWQRAGANLLMPEVLPAAAAVLFSLLNAALIFGRDGKCLHDKLAKTRVERSDDPPTPVPPAPAPPPRPTSPPPSIPRPPVMPSVAFIQQPTAPAPEPPRRGSLADFVTQVSTEPPKKARLAADEPAADQLQVEVNYVPASRLRRLGARCLDWLLAVAAVFLGLLLVRFAPPTAKQSVWLVLGLYYTPGVIYWVITLYLIAKNGQHIGKRALGIKIVREDGSPVGLWRGFFRREFAYYAILTAVVTLLTVGAELTGMVFALIPINIFAFLAGIGNYLAIFRDSELCLHDQLAGTYVVYDQPHTRLTSPV